MAKLNSLQIKDEPVADYVIERTRTSDDRLYTKWSSGKSTMEWRYSIDVGKFLYIWGSCYLASGSSDGTNALRLDISYDANYFNPAYYFDSVVVTCYDSNMQYSLFPSVYFINWGNRTIQYYVMSPVKIDEARSIQVTVKLEGRWK